MLKILFSESNHVKSATIFKFLNDMVPNTSFRYVIFSSNHKIDPFQIDRRQTTNTNIGKL